MRRHVGFLKDGSITETISISGRLTKMEDVFSPLFACLLAELKLRISNTRLRLIPKI
jgi:hypothetical protein